MWTVDTILLSLLLMLAGQVVVGVLFFVTARNHERRLSALEIELGPPTPEPPTVDEGIELAKSLLREIRRNG